jgi:tRNA (cytidine/uridine-2'-O-)-methyltransferase
MFNVVLYQPENPYNTGGVARTCALLGARLHLVGPYGFPSLDRDARRASMGYLDEVEVVEHRDWDTYAATVRDHQVLLLWDEGAIDLCAAVFQDEAHLVFGSESVGLPARIAAGYPSARIAMPGVTHARRDHRDHSLNVSVAVGIALHQATRSPTTSSGS